MSVNATSFISCSPKTSIGTGESCTVLGLPRTPVTTCSSITSSANTGAAKTAPERARIHASNMLPILETAEGCICISIKSSPQFTPLQEAVAAETISATFAPFFPPGFHSFRNPYLVVYHGLSIGL